MEPYHHQRVLLSNGPAVSPGASLHFDYSYDSHDPSQHAAYLGHRETSHSLIESKSGILQDTSGNVGYLEEITYNHGSIQFKHEIKSPSFSHSPPLHSAEAAIKGELEYRRRPRFTVGAINLDRCELESPRYRQYREKQRKPKKGPAGPWSDDVEAAFQNALRLYAGRGRKKEECEGRLMGGNEFISHEIALQTGKHVCRKKVSSHIQVLKGLLKDNPKWTRLVRGIPDLGKGQHGRRDGATRSTRPSATGRVKIEPQDHPHHVDALYRRSVPPPIPSGPTIRSVSFDMRLCESCPEEQARHSPKVHHTYTSLQSEMGSECQHLKDLQRWQKKFPALDPYDEAGIPTPLFLFEAGLRLIDKFIERSQIVINFSVKFTEGSNHDRWSLRTKIHRRSRLINEHRHEDLSVIALGDGTLQINLVLSAHFWVHLFSGFNERKLEARRNGHLDRIRQVELDQRQHLESLHMTQELWTTSKDDSTKGQRMAVLLWKFHQTVQNQTPTTSWRRLVPPPAQQYDQMPNHELGQLPLKSEDLLYHGAFAEKPGVGAIQDIPKQTVWRGPVPGDPTQIPRSLDQSPSEDSSPKTSIHGDGRSSFPSSLATSFDLPSCELDYPTSLSQQGSLDSQDGVSVYPYLDTSPQQEGNYDPQLLQMGDRAFETEILHQSREIYAVDETTYYSQDQSQPFAGSIPEFPSFEGPYNTRMMEEMPVLEPAQQLIEYETLVPQLDLPDPVVAPEQHHHARITEVMSPATQNEIPLAAPVAQSISQPHILHFQHFEDMPPGFVLPEDPASPTAGPSPDGCSVAQSKHAAPHEGQPALHKEELADWELTFPNSLEVAPTEPIDVAPELRTLPHPTPADGEHDEGYEFLRGAMQRLEEGWEPLEGAMPSEEESQRWADEMAKEGQDAVLVEEVDTAGASQESNEMLGFIKVEKVEEDGESGE